MGKKGGATPVVDKSKASEANLNVIKRIDPDVEEVSQKAKQSTRARRAVNRPPRARDVAVFLLADAARRRADRTRSSCACRSLASSAF